ncbi:MAG: murein L,D-transpeptidase, partial [Sulfurovum sp.]
MIKIKRLCLGVAIVSTLLFTQAANADTEFEYHELASTVMINSLQTQPQDSFLKKLYTQLLFVPVWMNEDEPSPAANALFGHIKDDQTLDRSGKLYQYL